MRFIHVENNHLGKIFELFNLSHSVHRYKQETHMSLYISSGKEHLFVPLSTVEYVKYR